MTCFTLGWTQLLLQELIEIPFLNWVARQPELMVGEKKLLHSPWAVQAYLYTMMYRYVYSI